jgi:hypothetical protein
MRKERDPKETRLEWLAQAEQQLNELKNSKNATAEQINYAEYKVALHINVLHDMNGMSN